MELFGSSGRVGLAPEVIGFGTERHRIRCAVRPKPPSLRGTLATAGRRARLNTPFKSRLPDDSETPQLAESACTVQRPLRADKFLWQPVTQLEHLLDLMS
jgi:hypothetical protein